MVFSQVKYQSGRYLRLALTLLAGWAVVSSVAMTGAQQPGARGFQAYTVENISPADAERDLSRLFVNWGEKVEIIADATYHRVLVNGSPKAQELVRQTLAALDKPSVTKPVAEPVLKSYPFATGDVTQITAAWQAQTAGQKNVKIAADARTRQVIVIAPPEVHAVLERQAAAPGVTQPILPTPTSAPAQATATVSFPASAKNAPAKADVQPNLGLTAMKTAATGTAVKNTLTLKHCRWQQVEEGVKRLYGRNLPKATIALGDNRALLVFDAGEGHKLTIEADPQTNQVTLQGPQPYVVGWSRIIESLDTPQQAGGNVARLVGYQNAERTSIQKAVDALTAASKNAKDGDKTAIVPMAGRSNSLTSNFLRPRNDVKLAQAVAEPKGTPATTPPATPAPATPGTPTTPAAQPEDPLSGPPSGPVSVEYVEALGIVIIRGRPEDVAKVQKIIEQIETASATGTPDIRIHPLNHVAGELVAGLLQTQGYFSNRIGSVSITPLGKPNALLMIGQREAVDATIEFVKKLDVAVKPETQFQVFQLKYANYLQMQASIQNFFAGRAGLGTRLIVEGDPRTNALIVQASPRDMAEVEEYIKRIDVATNNRENELRVFPLKRTVAADLGSLLQEAIAGQTAQRRTNQTGVNQLQQLQQPAQVVNPQNAQAQAVTKMLKFMLIDQQGRKEIKSGILSDISISADSRSNSLIISAPAESMELIAALVSQLDNMPAADSQIKVFTIINGDATNLANLLDSLFGNTQQRQGQQNQFQFTPFGMINVSPTGGGDENTLIPLRFSVDTRTNSIVASGTSGDLAVVEAILLRLDEGDVIGRKTSVFRLKNAPVTDVANAINQYLQTERQVLQIAPTTTSAFEQIQREVVVVAEPVNNSLIISATQRFYEEIRKLVEQLDERPPMVMIQVVIAEVALNSTDEFGVELGLQDSILFDRSLLGNLVTTTTTTTNLNGTTTNSQQVLAATNEPGFNFNTSNSLGNSGSTQSLNNRQNVGSQGLTNFAVGRTNNELGFGGLVLSASSESVSFLMRALHECRRLDVLSRPQVMTLDNQPAYIQVGQRVPRITGVNISTTGQVNTVTLENVGLIMQVIPRISPDGLVVMQIDAEKSALGPEAEGIPINITATGQVIRSPRIDTTLAQTTVSALNGQTVVLGGLITKHRSEVHRRVPLLSEIPLLGNLFRYDNVTGRRTELLIIMTPRIVRNEHDAEVIKQTEAARMSWCLADVVKLHGEAGLRGRKDEWTDAETTVVYPDLMPTAPGPEAIPTPKPGSVMPGAKKPTNAPTYSRQTPPNDSKTPGIARNGLQPTPAAGELEPLPSLKLMRPEDAVAPNNQLRNASGNSQPDAVRTAPNSLPQPVVEGPAQVEPARYEAPWRPRT